MKLKISGCMALNGIRAMPLIRFNDSAIRDCLVTLVAILLFNAIQRPTGAIVFMVMLLTISVLLMLFAALK
jgi:hypothetical protein